jgi:hypothetical protein
MKPRIKGLENHPNYSAEHFHFISTRNLNSTMLVSQRYFTKPIDDYAMSLYFQLLDLKEKLHLKTNDLLFIASELHCTIGKFTLTYFLNKKYGPAFPPTRPTRESLAMILNHLKSEYRKRFRKKYKYSFK